MSHRKYHAPRHGSLGFLPKKRSKTQRGIIRSFPRSNKQDKPHFTAFMGYKAGITHVVTEKKFNKANSKKATKEVTEVVTILEAPPMVGIGMTGYKNTPKGLKKKITVWTKFISDEAKRRFYKKWYKSKKMAFKRYSENFTDEKLKEQLEEIKNDCSVVRLLAHTQTNKLRKGFKKAHIMEIQINGGTISEQVDFGLKFFEKEIPIDSVFSEKECVDVIGITKGHGTEGVIARWGVSRLPRKTHRGNRKVACIGAWHPARVASTIARVGQKGYHKRTIKNKKIYKIGNSVSKGFNAVTEEDLTQKNITPIGGFPHYGIVNNEYLMIKGKIMGTRKRVITLRKTMHTKSKKIRKLNKEEITIKFIDTSSKIGKGKFQTSKEKNEFYNRQ